MSVQSLHDLNIVLGCESSRPAEFSKASRAPEEGEALNLTRRLNRINAFRLIIGILTMEENNTLINSFSLTNDS